MLAGLVLLGLGLSASFLLSSSHAGSSGKAYTYPTYTYPTYPTTAPPPPPPPPPPTIETTEAATTTTTAVTTTAAATSTETDTTYSTPPTSSTTTTATEPLRPGLVGAKTVAVKTAANKGLKKTILVTVGGMTLYHNTTEKNGHIGCTGPCTSAWPPLLLAAGAVRPLAGSGVNAKLLGVLKRPDGSRQVTFNGVRLYRFAADSKPGQAKGQGLGGIWFAAPAPKP